MAAPAFKCDVILGCFWRGAPLEANGTLRRPASRTPGFSRLSALQRSN
jgi:hypothetical protein